jgi:hypothetical protein
LAGLGGEAEVDFDEAVFGGGSAGGCCQWDARTMTATNAPELARFIRKPYRRGFELQGGVSLTRPVA